jgi:hypothetical protein
MAAIRMRLTSGRRVDGVDMRKLPTTTSCGLETAVGE